MQGQGSGTHPIKAGKKSEKESDDRLRHLQDNIKWTNADIIVNQKEKREEKGQKSHLKK